MIKRLLNTALRTIGYELKKYKGYAGNKEDLYRLSQLPLHNHSLKLHFGCGPRILKGWINIDVKFEPFESYMQYYTEIHYPLHIRGDKEEFYEVNILKTGLPLPDNSVDLIFHEDFFEHLTQKEQVIFLAETLRVMKKGAVHRINTPNLLAAMRDNSAFKKGKKGVYTDEWEVWHHYNIITPLILKEMSDMVGYAGIEFNAKNKSQASHDLPVEYRPDERDRPAADSNVFADLIK